MVSKYAILLVSPVLLGTILNPGVLRGPRLWVHYTAVGSIEPSRQPSSRDEDLLPVPRFSGARDDTAGRKLPLLVVRIIRLGRKDLVRIFTELHALCWANDRCSLVDKVAVTKPPHH